MRTIPFSIALVLVLGWQGIAHASAPSRDMEMTRGGAEQARADEAAILRAVEAFAEGSIRADPDMMVGLWDASAAGEVSFIQVENELPVIGLENFRAYYEDFMKHLDVLSGDVSDVQIQRVGNIAYVLCRYNWTYKSVTGGPVLSQPTRATIVLRKHGQRWLYLHMHESMTYQQ